MWLLDNRTAFAAERGWVRDKEGAEVWLVAVKCTFDIGVDGGTRVSADQPPVLRASEHYGEPGRSSLRYDPDLVLSKITTDVIACGHAYAPAGKPTTQMDIGIKVGPVQKVLRVFGDREWSRSGPTSPVPFTKMPIIYERAFGGFDSNSDSPEEDWDWRNPVGTGFAVSGGNVIGRALPNIEYPNELVRTWKDRPRPGGFGPIASHWQPRVAYAGTYDDEWLKERMPLLPSDFDDRFFQCAPEDQQAPDFLGGGEQVVVKGLSPHDLRFQLPRVRLGFETHFYDGSRHVHGSPRLHTVILEPDHPRVSLVWHSAFPCHFDVHRLERTVVTATAPVREISASAAEAEWKTI